MKIIVEYTGFYKYVDFDVPFYDNYLTDNISKSNILKNKNIVNIEKYITDDLNINDWINISKNENITVDFIEKYINKIQWIYLLRNNGVPESFFREIYI